MKKWLLVFALIAPLFPAHAVSADPQPDKPLPRILLALYDSREESSPRTVLIHRFFEMPANHLGYDIHYTDINQPLPEVGDDVAGIFVWFDTGVAIPNAGAFLDWLNAATATGKKLIVVENLGIGDKDRANPDIAKKLSAAYATLGLNDDNHWHQVTYNAHIDQQDAMVNFERHYPHQLPPFGSTRVLPDKNIVSHLRVTTTDDNQATDLVVTSPGGGYIAEGYVIYTEYPNDPHIIQWYVNPFTFLAAAMSQKLVPIPDTTTLDGNRIFYSQIDGDGWNNVTEVEPYTKKGVLSSEVIEDEILKKYNDFAFDVSLITSDTDLHCYGVDASEKVARDMFALPNVEPSSHTRSHPLFWRFFEHYTVDKEKPFLKFYPPRPMSNATLAASIQTKFEEGFASHGGAMKPSDSGMQQKLGHNDESDEQVMSKYYTTPRSYACEPFNLTAEMKGAADYIDTLSPPGKKVQLLQWPGDTSPYEEAIASAREAGLHNINGGDSRFDQEYPSYAWVAPIGLQVGKERQIYSSNSNENTYTNLWTGRFFGFRYLLKTVENTESPIRIHPFNLYFHMYSGEKQASLDALKDNLNYARTKPLIHITATDYTKIAESFYTAQIIPQGDMRWKIVNRGSLQTFRFDNAGQYAVNFNNSIGVIGYSAYQGSLYITLDADENQPLIELTSISKDHTDNLSIYLVESPWQIKSLRISKNLLTFNAQGYGKGSMVWNTAPGRAYEVKVARGDKTLSDATVTADAQGKLAIDTGDTQAIDPVTVTMVQTN